MPCAFVFRCAFDSANFKVWIFLACLNFFSVFYELACQNIQEKIWQTQWNTFYFFNSVFCLCSVSCSFKNQVPYFKAVTDSNLTRLLLREKKKNIKKKKKKKKKKPFRSGPPICHELWDTAFIFLALYCNTQYQTFWSTLKYMFDFIIKRCLKCSKDFFPWL